MFSFNNTVLSAISFIDSFLSIPSRLETARVSFAREGWVYDHFAKELATLQVNRIYSFYNQGLDRHKAAVNSPGFKALVCFCQIVFWTNVMVFFFLKEEGWQKRLQPQLAKCWPAVWGWFYSNILVEEGLEGLGTQAVEFKPEVIRTATGAIPVPGSKVVGYLCAAKKVSEVRETEQACSVELSEDCWEGASGKYTSQFSFAELEGGAIAGYLPAAKEEVCEESNKVAKKETKSTKQKEVSQKGFASAKTTKQKLTANQLQKPYKMAQLNKASAEAIREVARREGVVEQGRNVSVIKEELVRLK